MTADRIPLGEPAIRASLGSAWRAVVPRGKATLDAYLVHRPGVHVAWSRWLVNLITLGDVPGMPPARVRVEGATHEIIVVALNPDYEPALGWESHVGAHYMTPVDLEEQIVGLTDDQARELLRLLARAFCDGLSAPDRDYRRRNAALIVATAAHMRSGAPCQELREELRVDGADR